MTRVPAPAAFAIVLTLSAASLPLASPGTAATHEDARASYASNSVRGTWKGLVSDGGNRYHARVRIYRHHGSLHGRVSYPDAPVCRGTWTYRTKDSGWRKFTERITDDPGRQSCVERLSVKAKRVDSRLKVVWTYHARTARMLAHRV